VWRRRVQRAGSGSFLVTLPKTWVEQNRIDKNTIITMVSNADGSLTLVPEGSRRIVDESIEIDLSKQELSPQDVLLGSYLLGYNTVTFKVEKEFSTAEISEIRKTVRRLPGAEISEETSNQMEVRVLLDPEMVTPEKLIRRQSSLTGNMIVDCVKALLKWDRELAERIVERDEEVDRQYFILVRIIRSALRNPELPAKMGMDYLKLMDLRMLVKYVEDSADQCVYICREIARARESPPEEFLTGLSNLGEVLGELHSKAVELFNNFDRNLFQEVIKKHKEVGEKLVKLEGKQGYKEHAASMIRIFNSLTKIVENIRDIVELVSMKPL
jgi:phosphate uptake regulator